MSTARTLRISGIPADISAHLFLCILEEFIDTNSMRKEIGTGKNILLSSFAPSASSADRETVCIATVTLRVIPPVLQRGGPINVKGLGRRPVYVDVDFFGLTPLNNPTREINVDIVAVTGLAGHAFGSWKSRGAATMWLRDFLPEYVPTARILTYGYDSTLYGSDSTSSVRDFSGRLLETLKTARVHEDERHRPIIFIGHSLGGLVIKHALVMGARGSERDRWIFSSCYGLLFFGVPNNGLSIESLRTMVDGQPNSRLIEDLDPRSTSLRLLHEAFSDYFRFEDSRIISIFETKETKTVVESTSEKGVWRRTGPTVLMVSEESATYSGLTKQRSDQLSIDADHSDITKFSHNQNPDFLTIRQRIIEFVGDAPEAIKKRFGSCPPDVHNRIKTVLCPTDFELDTSYRSWDHCEGTGDWLLSDPDYVQWEEMQSEEILWLRGSPGSGKTYLISKVLERVKQRHGSEIPVAFFFCDNKSENSGRRATSCILKTVVSQLLLRILPSHPADVEMCLQEYEKYGARDEVMPWLFQNTLKRIGGHLSQVFLIIDALDECDDAQNLLRALKGLSTIETTTFQIIISSRDSIGSLLSSLDINVHGIRLSPERLKNDIKTFIHRKVQELHIRGLGIEDETTTRLTESCDSLFLLAHLHIESLRRDTPQDLDEALHALPDNLTQFYTQVLGRIQKRSRHERTMVRKVFMWVIFAKRPLNFKELREIVSIPARDQGSSGYSSLKITQRALDELCGGLLVFKSRSDPDPSTTIIELAHKTVKECVADFVWNTTSPEPCLSDQEACTSEILQVAIGYMYGAEDVDQKGGRYPLLDYVYNFWILHLIDSKQPSSVLVKDLDRFLESNECYAWWDSPISASLNGSAEARLYLQSRFQSWMTTNISRSSRVRSHMYFMTKLQERQVASYTQQIGKDHLDTLAVRGNLGETYRHQGRWSAAAKVERDVKATCFRVLGENHPRSVIAADNLAKTFATQGLWSQAEGLRRSRMEACVKLYGMDHADSLTAAGQLAQVYKSPVQFALAEELQQHVMSTCKRLLGDGHVNTLVAMSDLARTYKRQARFDRSIELYQEVVITSGVVRGEDHPATLAAICNLAGVFAIAGLTETLKDMKKLETFDFFKGKAMFRPQPGNGHALELQKHAVAALKRVLGELHLDTLAATSDLAFIHLIRGQWQEATLLFEHVLETRVGILGRTHPQSIFSRLLVAFGNVLQGNFAKAIYHQSIYATLMWAFTFQYLPSLADIRHESKAIHWIKLDINGFKFSIPDLRLIRSPDCGIVLFDENVLDMLMFSYSGLEVMLLAFINNDDAEVIDLFSIFDGAQT